MKINGHDNIVHLDKAYSGDRIRNSERHRKSDQMRGGEQTNAAGDRVNISSRGAQIQKIKSMIGNMPDIRHDRVDIIKLELEHDQYQINSDKIAHSIIRENMMDSLL